MLFKYLKHFFNSKGPDRIHSPFVFDLYYHTLKGNLTPYNFLTAEIASGIKKSSKSEIFYLQTIYKLINIFKPKSILCLGKEAIRIACHIHKIQKEQLVYLEKNTNTKNLSLKNVIITENSKQIVSEVIIISSHIDLNQLNFNSTFFIIVTDLFKTEQQDMWQKLIEKKRFNISLDCFYIGICFHKPNQEKEYFKLRF